MLSRRGLIVGAAALAAHDALAQGVPGLAIPPGLLASAITLVGSFNPSDQGSGVTLSNNNLTMVTTAVSTGVRSTNSIAAGQWYLEAVVDSGTPYIGVGTASSALTSAPGFASQSVAVICQATPNVVMNGSGFGSSGIGAVSAGDIIGVKVDADADTICFNRNNGTFSTTYQPGTGLTWFILCGANGSICGATLNLTPAYPIPAGFKYWGN